MQTNVKLLEIAKANSISGQKFQNEPGSNP